MFFSLLSLSPLEHKLYQGRSFAYFFTAVFQYLGKHLALYSHSVNICEIVCVCVGGGVSTCQVSLGDLHKVSVSFKSNIAGIEYRDGYIDKKSSEKKTRSKM